MSTPRQHKRDAGKLPVRRTTRPVSGTVGVKHVLSDSRVHLGQDPEMMSFQKCPTCSRGMEQEFGWSLTDPSVRLFPFHETVGKE